MTLTNLDGSGYLRGDWVNVQQRDRQRRVLAHQHVPLPPQQDDRFEQVMAYYWITTAQNYIQSLGFGSTLRPVNKESQDVRINQWGQDNSFSTDTKDELRFGKGGVDDAEDAEVILHEYGHAMMDSQQTPPGFGVSEEAGAIGEGFADYWAVTVRRERWRRRPTPACVADWDSVRTRPRCRTACGGVDTNLHYPEDLAGEVHFDGQIWSRALWDIRKAVGRDGRHADPRGDLRLPAPRRCPSWRRSTVAAAQKLYGNQAAKKVTAAFQARGIL